MANTRTDLPGTAVLFGGGLLTGWTGLSLSVGTYTVKQVASTLFNSKQIILAGDYSGGWPTKLAYTNDVDTVTYATTFTSTTYNAGDDQTTFVFSSFSPYVVGQNPNAGFNFMATLAVRADGTAANIAALVASDNDGSSAANAISWANLIADDANVSAGDIIELYDNGGTYTASSGIVLEMTADMSGTSGNPTIVRAATGNTPVIQNTGSAKGIDFATGSNFIDVDLDVTIGAAEDAVHASGNSGTNGSSYQFTNTFRGNITGTAGVSACEDGLSTDGTAELRAFGCNLTDIVESGASTGQAMTCHTDGKLLVINCNITDCNVAYADGTPTGTTLIMIGGTISGCTEAGVTSTTTDGRVILQNVTIDHSSATTVMGHTASNQAGRYRMYGCTLNLSNGANCQFNSDSHFEGNTFNLTGTATQIRVSGNSRCFFWRNTVNMDSIYQFFRVQSGGQVDFQGNLFSIPNSGNGSVVGYNSYTGTQRGYVYNNRFIGTSAGTRAQFTFIDCDVIQNTFANLGATGQGQRALDASVTTDASGNPVVSGGFEAYQNIFHNCVGNSGAYVVNANIDADNNVFSGTTAVETETYSRDTDVEFNGKWEPTTGGVFEGARVATGGGSAFNGVIDYNIINHNIIER